MRVNLHVFALFEQTNILPKTIYLGLVWWCALVLQGTTIMLFPLWYVLGDYIPNWINIKHFHPNHDGEQLWTRTVTVVISSLLLLIMLLGAGTDAVADRTDDYDFDYADDDVAGAFDSINNPDLEWSSFFMLWSLLVTMSIRLIHDHWSKKILSVCLAAYVAMCWYVSFMRWFGDMHMFYLLITIVIFILTTIDVLSTICVIAKTANTDIDKNTKSNNPMHPSTRTNDKNQIVRGIQMNRL